jgi:hypothetical protein
LRSIATLQRIISTPPLVDSSRASALAFLSSLQVFFKLDGAVLLLKKVGGLIANLAQPDARIIAAAEFLARSQRNGRRAKKVHRDSFRCKVSGRHRSVEQLERSEAMEPMEPIGTRSLIRTSGRFERNQIASLKDLNEAERLNGLNDLNIQ